VRTQYRLHQGLFQTAVKRLNYGRAGNVLTDAAKAFYEKVGFEPSPLDPHLLMITLADLIDANGARAGLGER
jgi:hypothetical protein